MRAALPLVARPPGSPETATYQPTPHPF